MDNFLFLPRAAIGALYDGLLAALTGILLSMLWLPGAARLKKALIAANTLLLLVLTAQLWLTTATMLGATDAHQILPELRDVLAATHAGRMTGLAILPALALLLIAPFTGRLLAVRISILPLIALVILRAATGHAAANGDFTFEEALQLIHLASTAIWAGTIMAAGLLVAPYLQAEPPALTRLGNRVSGYATVAIALVIATGLIKSWRGLGGSLPPLVQTQWGILLTVKSTLVLLALLLGLYNRLLLHRNANLTFEDAHRFTRGLRYEAILMLAILTLSSFLANSPPAIGS